jgi:hypothetical protein
VTRVIGNVVTLRGEVGSMTEHDAAIGTAHGARGVTRVIDALLVIDQGALDALYISPPARPPPPSARPS